MFNYLVLLKSIEKHAIQYLITTSAYVFKTIPKSYKGSSASSHDWLMRQLNDPYVKKAKLQNFRARSAFKLIEINEKYKLFRPGNVVIECGAAPGAWTQVIVPRINSLPQDKKMPLGYIIGIDLATIFPVEGATFLSRSNFTAEQTQKNVLNLLNGRKIDVIVSDMAPNASGIKTLDHEAIISLSYSVFQFAIKYSNDGGSFLCKIWNGSKAKMLENDLRKYYSYVKVIKPPSSRADSSEQFLIAKNFNATKVLE